VRIIVLNRIEKHLRNAAWELYASAHSRYHEELIPG
jgi:hypothetical protein